jgi:hypothetical protein
MKKLLIIFISLGFMAAACRHKPNVQPEPVCDSTNVSFKNTVQPILYRNCTSCHSTEVHTHGIILDNYENVRIFAAEGSLYGAILRNGEYAPMPYNAAKLDVCSISTIHHWIIEGMKNN